MNMISNIVKIPAYEKRRAFEPTLHQISTKNKSPVIVNITALDPSQEFKMFDGSFVSLTQWYRKNTSNGP
jgi:hypothetical protein